MKSPLRKLRGFGLQHNRNESKDAKKKDRNAPAKLDELVHASEEVQDMRNCYDSLLSAAAATANSVYEFSEALEEMGTCLLKKAALNDDDDDSGRVLMMLGKAQFELQKLVDSYRANIILTITTPSESLLKELQTVEDMKRQCDEKRDYYKFALAHHRERGRSKNTKTEQISSETLQAALTDYQEEAALFVFRLKSLQQGQFRSILTQATRHHAAQLSFFRRGLKYLEALEPHVKAIAELQHIQFGGLEDGDDSEIDDDYDYHDDRDRHHDHSSDDDDDVSSMDDHDDRGHTDDDLELSFDYGIRDCKDTDARAPRSSGNSMEFDQVNLTSTPEPLKEHRQDNIAKSQSDLKNLGLKPNLVSQSAPIFANQAFDQSQTERFRQQIKPTFTRKFQSYTLPLPDENSNNNTTNKNNNNKNNKTNFPDQNVKINKPTVSPPTNLWHSSPLTKEFDIKQTTNSKSGPLRPPPARSFGLSGPILHPYPSTDTKKFKREAYSGPIKPSFFTATSAAPHPLQRSASPNLSAKISLSHSAPRINELHELPRPPVNPDSTGRPSSHLVGYSGPLVSKRQVLASTTRASPLPAPPPAMARSYSIPSSTSSQRVSISVDKLLHGRNDSTGEIGEIIVSPPLTPMSLTNAQPEGPASSEPALRDARRTKRNL